MILFIMLVILAGVVIAAYYLLPSRLSFELMRKREEAEYAQARKREFIIETMNDDEIIKKQKEADAVKGGDPRGAYQKVVPAIDGAICPNGMRIRYFTNGAFCLKLDNDDRVVVDHDYNFIGVRQRGEIRDESNYESVQLDTDESVLVPRV